MMIQPEQAAVFSKRNKNKLKKQSYLPIRDKVSDYLLNMVKHLAAYVLNKPFRSH